MGYSDGYDEWREVGDIVSESGNPPDDIQTPQQQIQSYSLYKELSIKIKQHLTCGKKQVKINMGFDYLYLLVVFKQLELPKHLYRVSQGTKSKPTII